MKVTSFAQLEKELKKRILRGMKQVASTGQWKVRQRLDVEVYGASKPSYYRRTKELRQSVQKDVYQVGSFTNAVIYHDYKMMIARPPSYKNNHMGQHNSTSKGYYPQDYSFFVARTVNDGTSGKIFGEGVWTKPRPYFTNAEAWIFKNFRESLRLNLITDLKIKK